MNCSRFRLFVDGYSMPTRLKSRSFWIWLFVQSFGRCSPRLFVFGCIRIHICNRAPKHTNKADASGYTPRKDAAHHTHTRKEDAKEKKSHTAQSYYFFRFHNSQRDKTKGRAEAHPAE